MAGKRHEAALGFRGWALHSRDKALLSNSSVATLFLCQRDIVWVVDLEKAVFLRHPSVRCDVDQQHGIVAAVGSSSGPRSACLLARDMPRVGYNCLFSDYRSLGTHEVCVSGGA